MDIRERMINCIMETKAIVNILLGEGVEDSYDLRQDGQLIYRGSKDDCFVKLLDVQGSSWKWAIENEGYTISPTMGNWKDYVGVT